MTEPLSVQEAPTADDLLQAGQQFSDVEITAPAKVEVLAINADQALVRVIAGDGEVESKVVKLQ